MRVIPLRMSSSFDPDLTAKSWFLGRVISQITPDEWELLCREKSKPQPRPITFKAKPPQSPITFAGQRLFQKLPHLRTIIYLIAEINSLYKGGVERDVYFGENVSPFSALSSSLTNQSLIAGRGADYFYCPNARGQRWIHSQFLPTQHIYNRGKQKNSVPELLITISLLNGRLLTLSIRAIYFLPELSMRTCHTENIFISE